MGIPDAPDVRSAALVTVDVQRDTLDGGPLEVPGTSEVVPSIGRLCGAFRAAGRPIVHVVRLYLADGSNAEPFRRDLVRQPTPILRPGTPGRLLAPGLLPVGAPDLDDGHLLAGELQPAGPDEVIMYKPRWGAFYRTPLEDHLAEVGVTAVVVAGCNFPNCPRTTIYEASERDYEVTVAVDATSGLYDRALDELRGIGVHLLDSATIAATLGERPPAPTAVT